MHWYELMHLAAEIGLSKREFWASKMDDFNFKVLGYNRRTARRENGLRSIYTLIHNTDLPAHKQKTPQRLWPIPLFDEGLKMDKKEVDPEKERKARKYLKSIAKNG